MERLKEADVLRLEELVQFLETSESTIRRDLDELEAEGKLRRVHGGAESLSPVQREESMAQKSVKNVQEKQALAQEAIGYIAEGDVIFLDAGTTTECLIGLLPQTITVVTNSIHHATKLVDKQIRTMIVGGLVKATTDASIGALAAEQIAQFHFDKAFLGMNGVDADFFMTPDPEEAIIKKTVLENTRQAYVLVDSSKLGQLSFVKVASVDKASVISQQSDSPVLSQLREKTRVIEV